MSHFIETCTVCKKITAQCRCMDCNKEKRFTVCDQCLQDPKKEFRDLVNLSINTLEKVSGLLTLIEKKVRDYNEIDSSIKVRLLHCAEDLTTILDEIKEIENETNPREMEEVSRQDQSNESTGEKRTSP